MNHLIKNISVIILLGGLWAVILHTLFSSVSTYWKLISISFYPLMFLGLIFISSLYFDLEISISRIVITALCSGLSYYLLSSYLPLLTIILVALILAAGFTNRSSDNGGFIITFLKGSVFIPVGIFTADLLILHSSALSGSEMLSWIILGAVLNIGFMFTIIPVSRLMSEYCTIVNNNGMRDEIDEFRVQATDIIKDLDSIQSG
ncbi:MAG: hypothetical protein GWO07_08600 [Candidatus Dadabacteria bacterium]|nr:hypothetical protein [Candidatus Dadabacteria bacterium]NIS08806.1 hypothetical protein [Candidatus Dadabacteria bacterium]NIY22156.1 hypothetical protein [Candidatus Dadabacteria bacterium]